MREAGLTQPIVLLEGFFDTNELPVIAVKAFGRRCIRQLPVSEVARWCDTILYTLLTCLTPRVPRYYDC